MMPPTCTSSSSSRPGAPSVELRQVGEHEIADRARAERAQRVGVAIERMAAQIEAERVLLVREQLHLGPRRRLRQADERQAPRSSSPPPKRSAWP